MSLSGQFQFQVNFKTVEAYNFSLNVIAQLSSSHLEQQRLRRKLFLQEVHALMFLLRQGLSLRGHTEIEGNLHQLLLSQAASDQDNDLKEWVLKGTYLSHDIINELVELVANNILRSLISDVRNARFFH